MSSFFFPLAASTRSGCFGGLVCFFTGMRNPLRMSWRTPQVAGNERPSVGPRSNGKAGSGQVGTVLHDLQAHARTAARDAVRDTAPVVLDRERHPIVDALEQNVDSLRLAVPDRVARRLLRDPVQVRGRRIVL